MPARARPTAARRAAAPENTLGRLRAGRRARGRRGRARRPPHRRRRPGRSTTTPRSPARGRSCERDPRRDPGGPPRDARRSTEVARRLRAAMLVNIEIKNFPGDPDYDPDRAGRGGGRRPARTTGAVATRCWCRRSASTRSTGSARSTPRSRPGSSTMLGVRPGRRGRSSRPGTATSRSHPFVARARQASAPPPSPSRPMRSTCAVNVWTVNDAGEMRRLADAGRRRDHHRRPGRRPSSSRGGVSERYGTTMRERQSGS